MAETVAPTRTFRRLVHARRDNPLARPPRIDTERALLGARRGWASVRAHWVEGWKRRDDARATVERAADSILQTGVFPAQPDVDVLAAAERMLTAYASLVHPVAARYGAAVAVAMKLRSLSWTVASGRDQKVWWWQLGEAPRHLSLALDIGWEALRIVTSTADARAYADAVEIAEEGRSYLEEPLACVPIDYAFPNEEAWAREDMDAALAAAKADQLYYAAPLFGSLSVAAPCIAFLGKCTPRYALTSCRYACDLVAAMEPAVATPVVLRQMELVFQQRHAVDTHVAHVAAALTSIVGEAMGRELARYFRMPRYARHFVGYFERNADIARSVLEEQAQSKSAAGDEARHVLFTHARAREPDAGTLDDAPALLRDAPWLAAPQRPEQELETLPYTETVHWEEGERERIRALPAVTHPSSVPRPIDATELAEFDALAQPPYVDAWPRWDKSKWHVLDLPDDRRLRVWDAGKAGLYHRPPCFMLATYGERALDGLFARDALDDERILTTVLRVDSPRSALVCARLLSRRKPWRTRARSWLREHAEASAVGLIPASFGRERRARRAAERALHYLAWARPEVVRSVAARYGDEAQRAVEKLVFGDPLARIVVRGKPPRWLRIDGLPALATRDGKPLPRKAARRLVDVLRGRSEDVPYAGIAVLRAELDPSSLEAFAWALFWTWEVHGRHRLHEWMALSLAALGGPAVVGKLARLTRDWAQSDSRACLTLVDVLAAVGGDEARLELVALSESARATVVTAAVKDALASLGAETQDRIDLDERGEAELDLGSRKLRVTLDEQLVPHVVLEDGRHVRQVPRPRKEDDPKRAAAATEWFRRLCREAKTVARVGLCRLERDMVAERRMRMSDFHGKLLRHALLGHAVRRLVWEARGDVGSRSFRVAEDGGYTDIHDLPLELDLDATVVLVHPFCLGEDEIATWGTLFADYEIVQPFEQLGRVTFRGTASEANAILKATVGKTVPARALLQISDAHGWERPGGLHAASASRAFVRGHETFRAYLSFSPGIALGAVKKAPVQKLGAIRFAPAGALERLDGIALSELVRTALALQG